MKGRNRATRLFLACALLMPGVALSGEVSLSGQGSVSFTPDSARLQFTANAEHDLPQSATEEVTSLMSQWRDAIENYQGELKDYTDANVNLYSRVLPGHERGEEPRKRAVASQTVSFRITDLSLLNPLLEEAQTLGLDYHLGPNQFFHSDEPRLEREALAKAIADAKAKCEFVASQLEQTCGEVISINVNGGFRPAPMMRAEAKGADDTVSSIGERQIQATVNATFELD
ncbi:SIMPL domain-containing protein [Marinobacter salinus]|uniref:SIMPL domain-containing protein n=1 Tax=Marinobacter salinus TaxID=1874317 RepID=A0A1D9GI61_9GAMM|nr:SIMPL domain-containing protein [Marinobacter salinus]AOY87185.1 SIMPL domain-containing protein [Marinobacter salinus]